MKALVFPGQGSQYPGMGKDLYESSPYARDLFEQANKLLGFNITDIMFEGTHDDLKQTKVTQPAIFIHSTILLKTLGDLQFDAVAGHSLGEFSALVANGALTFEDGLLLVLKRALAMQKACEKAPSTMAAIIGLPDETVEQICKNIDDVVVPANYNSPVQIVISGTLAGVDEACEKLREAGAKRAIKLPVGGAFHSPLMEPARAELAEAIDATRFAKPVCPVYQNVWAKPVTDPEIIKENLMAQLTAPVRWTQTIQNMTADGIDSFLEIGAGNVLQGLIAKIAPEAETAGIDKQEM